MELKYYLRGLGLGIIVTAIIMAVVSPGSQKMTDAEVIRRAKQLGMTEEKVLSDSGTRKEDASEEDASNEAGSPDENASADENEEQSQEKEKAVSAQTPADRNSQNTQQAQMQTQTKPESETVDAEPEEPDASEVGENVELERQEAEETNTPLPVSDTPMVVTIGSGDGSYAASRKLADIGAISSPENFDTFLCENGYDKKIRPGTYTIPADASDEQMARIITGAE